MSEKTWKRGDVHPTTGKVFVQWVTSRGKRYPYFATPERLEEIKAQNREAAKRVYQRDPAKRIRKVRAWQARKKAESEQPKIVESIDEKGVVRAAQSISKSIVISTGDTRFMTPQSQEAP